jgi:hypothetical protein
MSAKGDAVLWAGGMKSAIVLSPVWSGTSADLRGEIWTFSTIRIREIIFLSMMSEI